MNQDQINEWVDAIGSLYPNVEYSVDENGIQVWDISGTGTPQPSDQTIQDEVDRINDLKAQRESLRQIALSAISFRLSKSTEDVGAMSSVELAYELIKHFTGHQDTHYITLDGVDDYISLTGTGNCMDLSHGANWTLGFTVDQNYVGNSDKFSPIQSGDNNWTLYNGGLHSTIGDAVNALHWNTAAYAQGIAAGDKVILRADGAHIQFWWNNVQKHQATLGSNGVGAGSFDNLTIGNATTSATEGAVPNWNASIDNLLICAGQALDFSEMAEFFNSNDFDNYSFKDTKMTDFVTMGEDGYPNVTGENGVVTGTLVNGTPDNFVERS